MAKGWFRQTGCSKIVKWLRKRNNNSCWMLCVVNVAKKNCSECDTCYFIESPHPLLLPCLFSQLHSDTLQDRHGGSLLSWLMVTSSLYTRGFSAASYFGFLRTVTLALISCHSFELTVRVSRLCWAVTIMSAGVK